MNMWLSVWVGVPSLANTGKSFSDLEIFKLNAGWKTWYETTASYGLLGTKGDCQKIIQALPAAPLAP